MRAIRLLTVVSILLVALPVAAQERTWIKYHERIEFDGTEFGEYTVIRTHDELSPVMKRMLYRDDAGVDVVIRNETEMQGGSITASEYSVAAADGSEIITIAIDSSLQVTLIVGTGSMQYTDAATLPQSVKDQARELLEQNASQAFQDCLRRLARVGSYYSGTLDALGNCLRELFFHNMQPKFNRDYSTDPTEAVTEFDPNEVPPGTYEQVFGQAYYE